jgi:hypothetical protein
MKTRRFVATFILVFVAVIGLFACASGATASRPGAGLLTTQEASTAAPLAMAMALPTQTRVLVETPTRGAPIANPTLVSTPSETIVVKETQVFAVDGLKIANIKPVNLPSPDKMYPAESCAMLFPQTRDCTHFEGNQLYMGTDAKNLVASLIKAGRVDSSYTDYLDNISNNYYVAVFYNVLLPDGYSLFMYMPGKSDYWKPLAVIAKSDDPDLYGSYFLVPKAGPTLVAGVYEVATGEVIAVVRMDTGL